MDRVGYVGAIRNLLNISNRGIHVERGSMVITSRAKIRDMEDIVRLHVIWHTRVNQRGLTLISSQPN